MLTRIISGAVGAALIAVVLYFHSTIALPVTVAAIIAVMLFELLRAVRLHKCLPILIASEVCGISTPFIYDSFHRRISMSFDGIGIIGGADAPTFEFIKSSFDGRCTLISFGVTMLAAFVIFITWLKKHKEIRYEQVFFALAVTVFVPQSMTTMVRLDRLAGVLLLILGLCGAWIADTGAYFTGVAIGKHKLCPEISPKKTIEGFVGGILTTGIAFGLIVFFAFNKDILMSVIMAVIGMICAVVGTVGDLSASMVKRQIGFKDYGKIMPGHGGLMDRFDSVLFVLPTFYFLLTIALFL